MENQCKLCGRAVETPGEVFCCPGCAAVDDILSSLGLSGPAREERRDQLLAEVFVEPAAPSPETRSDLRQLEFRVGKMMCPGCAWIIHHALEKTTGVMSAAANFLAEFVRLEYDPMRLGEDDVRRVVERLGYDYLPATGKPARARLFNLGAGCFYALNVMALSFVVYAAERRSVPFPMMAACSGLLLLFSLAAYFGPGFYIIRQGFGQLRARVCRMESLIFLSTTTALVYSIYMLAMGQFARLYFDVVCLLLVLVEAGNLIEDHFYRKIRQRVDDLRTILPKRARVSRDAGEAFLPLAELQPEDKFIVLAGEIVPTDGILLVAAELDASLVTGESRPVRLAAGQFVGAGSRLLTPRALLALPPAGRSSLIERIVDAAVAAFDTRPEAISLGDRISRRFAPFVMLVALGVLAAFVVLGDPHSGFIRCMSVLIVACPCAFGIAEPLVLMLAAAAVRRQGVQVFNAGALKRPPTAVVFDKTGTLTLASYVVAELDWLAPDKKDSLDILASLESGLEHPIARCLAQLGQGTSIEARRVEGTTVRGVCGGRLYQAGKLDLYPALEYQGKIGKTLVAFGDEDACYLVVALDSETRPEALEVVAGLAESVELHLCSGDREDVVRAVADELGIRSWRAEMSVADKTAMITDLQAAGEHVMMVGDGVNDAPALAAADFGAAVYAGQIPARLSADGVLLRSDLAAVRHLVGAMRTVRRRIAANYSWSFLYNAVGLILAVAGKLSPTFCAVGMVFSSVLVVVNSARRFPPAP